MKNIVSIFTYLHLIMNIIIIIIFTFIITYSEIRMILQNDLLIIVADVIKIQSARNHNIFID